MKEFYQKLIDMEPGKFTKIMWISGILSGIICWLALRAGSFTQDGLLQWAFVIVFAIVMIFSNKVAKETGLNVSKFRIGMCVGLGACIAVFAVALFSTGGPSNGGTGLIELLFPALNNAGVSATAAASASASATATAG